ncbi:MAG: hypothetical protein ACJ79Q_00300 [Gemmatimonadaceae bacterium]|jgi:predicted protein tyrosine phosphatase
MRRAASAGKTPTAGTPEIIVLSRDDAESYEPRGREICISIFDPDAEPARVSPRFASVLRLSFDDIIELGESTDILFARDHAAAIGGFIDDWPAVDRIVIHCNMGVSRSPAVALGLCDRHGWATAKIERSHPGWNRLVRAVMRESSTQTGGA